jgi:hypothetical protein
MRGRTAKKVFRQACKGWTEYKGLTLAMAARKVTKMHVPTKDAWFIFMAIRARAQWPNLQLMFADWLEDEYPGFDADNIRKFLK